MGTIKIKDLKGFFVISLAGDMGAYDAEDFERKALGLIKKDGKDVIVDFRDLEYISSSGLRALLNIKKRLEAHGRRLLLVSLRGKVLDVFRVSKIIEMFEVYEDIEEATEK